jgi:hypothetical protein
MAQQELQIHQQLVQLVHPTQQLVVQLVHPNQQWVVQQVHPNQPLAQLVHPIR